MSMRAFITKVLRGSEPSVNDLPLHTREKMKTRCESLQDIYQVFEYIANVAPAYRDKDWYVIQRLLDLFHNYMEFSDKAPRDELPSDAEIVCSTMCALMEYSVKSHKDLKHSHYFDNNTMLATLRGLKKSDLAIINTQPRQYCRPHFELVINNVAHPIYSVSCVTLALMFLCV